MQNPFGTHFMEIRHPFRCSFGCVLLWTWCFENKGTVRQYWSDLSDQPALEIRVRIEVKDSGLHYFSIFPENKKSEHLIFREFHGR